MTKTLEFPIRLMLIQLIMMMLFTVCLSKAQASSKTITVDQQVNSYLINGDKLDLAKELDLEEKTPVIKIEVQAQGVGVAPSLNLLINGKSVKESQLADNFKDIQFKIKKLDNIKKLEIKSNGAFVSFAKAELVSDEPMDDDLSINLDDLNI
tara:strand:- start:116 stop:571 length:456 start_codon:yes stop_codon:yes gene_type:complete